MVTVKMERMATIILVVENHLHNLILLQHKAMSVRSVDLRVCRLVAARQDSVESRHLGRAVSDVVEECIIGAIAEIVHDDLKLNLLARLRQQWHLIIRHEIYVVIRVKLVDSRRLRERLRFVIDKPARYVPVEVVGQDIKQILYSQPSQAKERQTYSIHACHDRKVGLCISLGRDEHAASLSSREVDHVGFSWLGVCTINLDDGHLVTLNPEILSSKSTKIDQSQEIRLAGLHWNLEVLRLIHESSLRNRLSTSRVSLAKELGEQGLHLIMVPVGKRHDNLLIVFPLERRLWVVNDEISSKTIRILTLGMRVIPVGSSLSNLPLLDAFQHPIQDIP